MLDLEKLPTHSQVQINKVDGERLVPVRQSYYVDHEVFQHCDANGIWE